MTSLVPLDQFARAVTFNSGAFQFSSVIGPTVFGAVIALTPHAEEQGTAWSVYALNALASIACFALVLPIKHVHKTKPAEPVSARSLVEGFRFVYQSKIILGIITLDLFAVLLGGAVTILPMFANDIFHVGAGGFGWLRNAMPIGAVICMVIIAHRPPLQKAGRAMLLSVAIFGVATILFGVANQNCFGGWLALPGAFWFWFSFAMLALAGAVDNISVVVRQTLVQILTPDEKRGRVSAVNSLFIGTSNELGGFRSGIVAYLFTVPTFLGQRPRDGRDHLHRDRRHRNDSGGAGRGVDLAGDTEIRKARVKKKANTRRPAYCRPVYDPPVVISGRAARFRGGSFRKYPVSVLRRNV